jgi:glycosyltransferase involved in cell wall biosynthesis
MKNNTVSIVIPCLNEASTIEKAVLLARKALKSIKVGSPEIIVADNGSTDGSVQKTLRQNIARVVKVPVRGYGAALHWGIMNAKSKYVFFADADLSYNFMEIKKFLPFIHRDYDLVLGSRFEGRISEGAMPFLHRYFGTPILTFLIRIMYGIKTTDCNSGMRLVRKSFYKKLKMRNSGMEWASELLCKTAIAGGKYGEVPIRFYKDKRGRKPHLLSWADGWRHWKAIFLIKPNYMFAPVIVCGFLAAYFVKRYFALTYFFSLLAGSIFLSVLAAKMLNYATGSTQSRIINIVNKMPIVVIAAFLSICSFIALFVIPDVHLGTKLGIASAVIIFDVWVFLMETIKTHLVNRLPD